MLSVRYELGFYIQEDGILHSRRLQNLKSYKDTDDSNLVCQETFTGQRFRESLPCSFTDGAQS
jgi:hypothetical protein